MGNELERERIRVVDIFRSDDKELQSSLDIHPKLKLQKVSVLSLYELDVLNRKENGEEYIYRKIYVCAYISDELDKIINKLQKEGKVVIVRGVLVIEECRNEDEYQVFGL